MSEPLKRPSIFRQSSVVILLLRLTIIFSIITMTATSYHYRFSDVPLEAYIAAVIFLANTILGYVDYLGFFNKSRPPLGRASPSGGASMVGFIVDLVAMTLFIYYSGSSDAQQFYVVFLIIVLITATIHSVVSAFLTTLIGVIIYGFITTKTGTVPTTEVLLSGQFLSRISFLFIVATFIGYLAEEAERQRRDKIASEQFWTAEIKNLSEYLKNVFQSVPSGMIVVDNTDRITVFNKKAEEMFGMSAPNVLGQQISNVSRLRDFYRAMAYVSSGQGVDAERPGAAAPQADPVRDRSSQRDDRSDGEKHLYSTGHPNKDILSDAKLNISNGAEIVIDKGVGKPSMAVAVQFSILRNALGKTSGTIGVFQDITRLKQCQVELIQKERMASLGQLTNEMAHDLFSILNLLKDVINNPGNASVPALLDTAKRDIDDFLPVVRNILSFSSPPQPVLKLLSITEVINDAIGLIKYDLDRDGIEIITTEDKVVMMTDPDLLRQALLNLLINARDAIMSVNGRTCPEGCSRRITIEMKKKVDYAEITIADTGRGAPRPVRKTPDGDKNITPSFGQSKELSNGARLFDLSNKFGLGLYVAREIIQSLKGTIEAGTSGFTVKLPYSGPR